MGVVVERSCAKDWPQQVRRGGGGGTAERRSSGGACALLFRQPSLSTIPPVPQPQSAHSQTIVMGTAGTAATTAPAVFQEVGCDLGERRRDSIVVSWDRGGALARCACHQLGFICRVPPSASVIQPVNSVSSSGAAHRQPGGLQ